MAGQTSSFDNLKAKRETQPKLQPPPSKKQIDNITKQIIETQIAIIEKQNNILTKQPKTKTLRFDEGMLGQFVCKKETNTQKGKGKRERQTEQHKKTMMFSQKGLMKKETSKDGIVNRKRKEKDNEEEEEEEDDDDDDDETQEKEKDLEERGVGGTEEQKPLKLRDNGPFCLFQREEKPPNQKPKPNKKRKVSKRQFACWNITHHFC